ncbi:MAG TPA: hypothetical protein VGF75_04230 [Candidatus Saccharimonadales bacterium]|jgi:hypothetical protein
MKTNERLHQAIQRTQILYREKRLFFLMANEAVSDYAWSVVAPEAERPDEVVTPERLVEVFLGTLLNSDRDTHDSLIRNVSVLAEPIGSLCALRLFDGLNDGQVKYAEVEDVTIVDSGLLPSAQIAMVLPLGISPAIELASPAIRSMDFPFMRTSPPDDERGRRYTVDWSAVREIELR